ncbi:MAG: hypothetical protein WC692_02040 [Erythrobacter sp.]|jgi:hypothetical protein
MRIFGSSLARVVARAMAMAMIDRKTCFVALALGTAAGCSGSGSGAYPSLAIRNIERVEGSFEPVATEQLDVPPVEVDLAGGLDARLAALVRQAEQAHLSFTAATPRAEEQVAAARDAQVGSDPWAIAQVALADLDSARSETAVALGDLDILHVAATLQADDLTAIDAARAQVTALVSVEDATLERLRARMR